MPSDTLTYGDLAVKRTEFMLKAQVYLKYCIHQLKKPEAYQMDIVKVVFREEKPYKLRMKSIYNQKS